MVNGVYIDRLASDIVDRPSNSIPAAGLTNDPKNGYWITVNNGQRGGSPNVAPGWGGLGDPYGSCAVIYVYVPKQLASSDAIPDIQVLVEGKQIRIYTGISTFTEQFTSNPAWILLDVLKWSNWRYDDIDIQSFIDVAAICDEQIYFMRMDGAYANEYNESDSPEYLRFSVGFCLRQRQAIGQILQGLRNAMRAVLYFDTNTGKLKVKIKQTLGSQQPSPVLGSNYNTPVDSWTVGGTYHQGYVAYSFDYSNILKDPDTGKLQISVHQLTNNDSPNKSTTVFQNRENGYSQDSLTVVDTEDVSRLGFEVTGSLIIIGPQTFDHVNRVSNTLLAENFRGNGRANYEGSYIGDTGGTVIFDLVTSVKALAIGVGDICAVSDPQHGISMQLARVTRVKPSQNFETCQITLAWHNDVWYFDTFGQAINQPIYSREMNASTRPPYSWRPDYEIPMADDVCYDASEHGFGVAQTYDVTIDSTTVAAIQITGKVPVNSFPTKPRRPQMEMIGAGAIGGEYPTSATYYVGIASMVTASPSSLISAISDPVVIRLDSPNNALSFAVQNWPDSPAGYFAFAGPTPLSMSYQASVTATPSPILLTNKYNVASWGPPDELFYNFRWRVNAVDLSGVFVAQVTGSVTSTSIQVTLGSVLFSVDQWAGRRLSLLGIMSEYQGGAPDVPIANFLVSGNDVSGTLQIASGNPTTCVGGDPIQPGDVVTMRLSPTFGSDSTGYYFEDALLSNALSSLGVQYPIVVARVGTGDSVPVHAGLTIGPASDSIGSSRVFFHMPFSDGDDVVVTGARGTAVLNGSWAIDSVNPARHSFNLVGSSGYGTWTGGGTVAKRAVIAVDSFVGDLAFIVAGTGKGTYVKISHNTSARFYISGTWPIAPDSTSVIIFIKSTPFAEAFSDQIANSVLQLVASYKVDVPNITGPVLVRASSRGMVGVLSREQLDPFREIFVFGNLTVENMPVVYQ